MRGGNGIEFCVMDKGCSLPRTNDNQTMVPMMVERERVLPVKKKNDCVANDEEMWRETDEGELGGTGGSN